MTVIKTIVSVIHFISVAVVVLGSPLLVADFFGGERGAERFFKIFNPPVNYSTFAKIYIVFMYVALITTIIKDLVP